MLVGGESTSQSLTVECDTGHCSSRLFFVVDHITGTCLPVDTGAELSYQQQLNIADAASPFPA